MNDETGRRVRSLPGDCRVGDYRAKDGPSKVEVLWDGLDDRGTPAAPGKYRVVGLTRGAVTPVFERCFYNPGSPPWATADGTGGWGADHSPPVAVAAGGDGVVVGWAGAEGGSGVMGVGPDGNKKWGQQQGVTALAADDRFAYFMLNDDWAGKRGLARLSARRRLLPAVRRRRQTAAARPAGGRLRRQTAGRRGRDGRTRGQARALDERREAGGARRRVGEAAQVDRRKGPRRPRLRAGRHALRAARRAGTRRRYGDG